MTTPDFSGRQIALLPEDFLYTALIKGLDGEWSQAFIDANVALCGQDGTTVFYKVHNGVWWSVITYPPGWVGPYSAVQDPAPYAHKISTPVPYELYGEPDPVVHLPTVSEVQQDLPQLFNNAEQGIVGDDPGAQRMREDLREAQRQLEAQWSVAAEENRAPVQDASESPAAQDAVELFEVGQVPHRKLKDIWEGKGDDVPDPYTTFNDPDDLASGWTPDQYDAKIEELRAKSPMSLANHPARMGMGTTQTTAVSSQPAPFDEMDNTVAEPWHGKAAGS